MLLTQRYYQQGYEEGFAEGLNSGQGEGYDFGHAVAFQKFLPLGIIFGRCTAWRRSLSQATSSISEVKKTRALKQIENLERMIAGLDRQNETEADHGKFEEMKKTIISKSRVLESLMGEERKREEQRKDVEEDSIALAKRMDRELLL
jgi:hypothetical protein